MKKKIIGMLLLAWFTLLQVQVQAQYKPNPQIYYLLLTSTTLPDNQNLSEGIRRSTIKVDPADANLYNNGSSPIMFTLVSKSRGIDLAFLHADYNLTELAKIRYDGQIYWNDEMEILEDPYFFKYTVTDPNCNCVVVNLDIEFPTMTQQQSFEFRDKLQGKRIYIIDKSDGREAAARELIEVVSVSVGNF